MPPYDIAFSNRAGRDLREIRAYLTKNASLAVALKVVSSLLSATEALTTQPERYPPEPLLVKYGNYRVLRHGSYKIYYEFTGQEIYIVRVLHVRRDLQRILRNFKP